MFVIIYIIINYVMIATYKFRVIKKIIIVGKSPEIWLRLANLNKNSPYVWAMHHCTIDGRQSQNGHNSQNHFFELSGPSNGYFHEKLDTCFLSHPINFLYYYYLSPPPSLIFNKFNINKFVLIKNSVFSRIHYSVSF